MTDDGFSGLYRPQTDSYLQYRALDKPGMTYFDDSRTVEVMTFDRFTYTSVGECHEILQFCPRALMKKFQTPFCFSVIVYVMHT
jgi:hypothetical protein